MVVAFLLLNAQDNRNYNIIGAFLNDSLMLEMHLYQCLRGFGKNKGSEPIYITKNGEGDLVVMSIEAFEKREEIIKLRAKLELAEQSRLANEPTFTLEQSKQRLDTIYEQTKI